MELVDVITKHSPDISGLTNVGDMPLDIYSDYLAEQLEYEFFWEYFVIFVENYSVPRNIRYHFGVAGRFLTNYNGIGYEYVGSYFNSSGIEEAEGCGWRTDISGYGQYNLYHLNHTMATGHGNDYV